MTQNVNIFIGIKHFRRNVKWCLMFVTEYSNIMQCSKDFLFKKVQFFDIFAVMIWVESVSRAK